MQDNVNHPQHYTSGDIECIDALESTLGKEGFESYCIGNAMKYLWRCRRKGNKIEDLKKAAWYIDRIVNPILCIDEDGYLTTFSPTVRPGVPVELVVRFKTVEGFSNRDVLDAILAREGYDPAALEESDFNYYFMSDLSKYDVMYKLRVVDMAGISSKCRTTSYFGYDTAEDDQLARQVAKSIENAWERHEQRTSADATDTVSAQAQYLNRLMDAAKGEGR